MSSLTLAFDILARDKASKVLDDVGRSAKDAGDKTESSFGKVGGIIAGAFAGTALIGFGKQLLDTGTQTEILRTKVQTVFGDQANSVKAWADKNNEALGLTDDQLGGLAASFGDLLVPMGFTREAAADMSKKTIELSGALSAWSGGQRTAAEVSQILSNAMLGERDGLKELGISISDAEVKQRLMENGQKDLTGAALQQATALVTQQLIVEKSTDAQKAWADGSMDNTKTQNEMKAKLSEVTESLATGLLPAFSAIASFIVDKVIPGIENLSKFLQDNKTEILAVGAGIMVALVPALAAWALGAISAAIPTLALAAPIIAIGVLIGTAALLVVKNWDTIKTAFGAAKDFIAERVRDILGFFSDMPGKIGTAIGGLAAIITAPYRAAFDGIARLWNSTVGSLSFTIPDWVPGIGGNGFNVPDIPVLHDGGMFRAPTPGGEGLALLRDREQVSTPETMDALLGEVRLLRAEVHRQTDVNVRLARSY